MEKTEKVGKVILDYQYYGGQDLYCDGDIEDDLLEAVQNHEEDELEKIINEKKEWEFLYHFSQVRQNIVNWIPVKKDAKILEIGSGCGAITGALAKKGQQVDCVELSRKRSLINANRNKNYDGITIKLGNFEEIESYLDTDYDIITLIGVWEYAGVYLKDKDPFRKFLDVLKKHLSAEGKIIIAIENRNGLKYWAGCREDHTAQFFEGLEGYTKTNSAVTFGKNEMQRIFEETGYQTQFYYPYPDYKLPLHIFSDEYLPHLGMLTDNHKNLDHTRMVFFDEAKVFDSLIKDGMFSYFSNSFLVILQPEGAKTEEERVIYSKFSNERVEEFRIRTDIIKKSDGTLSVEKYPMHEKAKEHINKIQHMYQLLQNNAKNIPVQFNVCEQKGNHVAFEYVEGQNLENEIKQLYLNGKTDKIREIVADIVGMISAMQNTFFTETEEFRQVFGECPLQGIPAIKGADIDLVFGNIIRKDNIWNIIDYEWSFDFPIPVNYILYRILYFQAPKELKRWNLCFDYGISEEEQKIYENMELHFMLRYVYKDKVMIQNSPVIKPQYILNEDVIQQLGAEASVKVYYDRGEGFSENNIDVFLYGSAEKVSIDIPISSDMKGIRLDPMECRGIVHLLKVEAQTEGKTYRPEIHMNGIIPKENYLVFDTEDPWILFTDWNAGTEKLHVEFSVNKASKPLIDEVVDQYGKIENESKVKVYYDRGQGMSEDDTVSFYYESPEYITLDIPIDHTITSLRIDPMESCGIVRMKNIIVINTNEEYAPQYQMNGYILKNNMFIFDTEDPWIILNGLKAGTDSIHIEMSIDKMSKISAEILSEKYKKRRLLRKFI